ncbi:MAG: acetyl-coenzyme A synthetase N-terminal domain-containing protein, partial [Bacteroidota bacterium]
MDKISSFQDYQYQYEKSISNPEGFWSDIASSFEWMRKWDAVLNWDFDRFDVKWFNGAKLNITVNCLDRHAATSPDRIAVIWEGNDPAEANRVFTYQELLDDVCRCANGLKSLGVQKGDRVCLYMPMVPELLIAVL